MATKKKVIAKTVKAVVKPAAKKVIKAAPKKVVKAAPKKVVKAAPKKVVKAIPVKKLVKPAPKKVAPKVVVKAKKAAPKPIIKAAKVVAKKVVIIKKATKPVAKKVVIIKKAASAKKITAPVKSNGKIAVKPVQKIMSKKEESKKAPEKTVVVKAKEVKAVAPKPVVIPKISTKTVRKYQPEFTKSVLDKAQLDPGAPSQRYSDNELSEFKELIQRKLEAAKKELSYLQGLITRKDEMGGDEGDNRYMTMEDGGLSMEREQLSQMASRQITFIDHLEKAIMRIENKTYGICRVTGRLIDKARLRAVPHATLSIEAKMGNNK